MTKSLSPSLFAELSSMIEGEMSVDYGDRLLYATDASAYREMPIAVIFPKNQDDLRKIIRFAAKNNLSLIPRAAGTSLAGQVVGNGMVVDISVHLNQILELNKEQGWVKVQPGVIRDELNLFLKAHGLFFGPETSTANRAMIGGMVGNNSCGSNSVVYKSTREHLLEVKAILCDGSEALFHSLSVEEFSLKSEGQTLEAEIYRKTRELLSPLHVQEEIRKEFPKPSIERRNTGYAIDLLIDRQPFSKNGSPFNFCELIAGSEGTLAFITEIKLNVVSLPPKHLGLVCIHCNTIDESLHANLIALQHRPTAVELMDHYILECTKENIEHRENRFFVKGDPAAILIAELSCNSQKELDQRTKELITDLESNNLGYYYHIVSGPDVKKVWSLRKAGLGLLSNLPGDEKAVPVIEDTAVDVHDLPAYIAEFNEILKKYGLFSVHYAHAGSGELHLRPIINLKTEEGNRLFKIIAEEIAALVKKYKGSLSGEHGDGRLRGEFIQQMVGPKNYDLLKKIKNLWDPQNIFNPGKIVDTPPMNTMLRYEPGQKTPEFKTVFRFNQQDVLQHAEQCNGSGDCRKTHLSGGTMCPSYMATRREKDTTRARANTLREFLTRSEKANRFDHKEIYEAMDLCISCKACKSECPSNVDMAKLKAEFLQQYYDANGVPFRANIIGNYNKTLKLASNFPWVYNFLNTNSFSSSIIKKVLGFAPNRPLPLLNAITFKKWFHNYKKNRKGAFHSKIYLFADEFTNFHDLEIGRKTVQLMEKLGYQVEVPAHLESGRTYLSKGLLRKAKEIANENIRLLQEVVSEQTPIIGIEPSAILTLREEYVDLATDENLKRARNIARNTYLLEEFLEKEMKSGKILETQFTDKPMKIKLHGHCQQKALSKIQKSVDILSLPKNYSVELIASGCCGMAGSFGYEKEHYDVSMKIGELVLFPAVRNTTDEILVASGTSCRHQIYDGTGKKSFHPAEVLWEALR